MLGDGTTSGWHPPSAASTGLRTRRQCTPTPLGGGRQKAPCGCDVQRFSIPVFQTGRAGSNPVTRSKAAAVSVPMLETSYSPKAKGCAAQGLRSPESYGPDLPVSPSGRWHLFSNQVAKAHVGSNPTTGSALPQFWSDDTAQDRCRELVAYLDGSRGKSSEETGATYPAGVTGNTTGSEPVIRGPNPRWGARTVTGTVRD